MGQFVPGPGGAWIWLALNWYEAASRRNMLIPNIRRARLAAIGAVVVPALALTGCSKTLDSGQLDTVVKNALAAEGHPVTKVSCSDSITAKAYNHFSCPVSGASFSSVEVTTRQSGS